MLTVLVIRFTVKQRPHSQESPRAFSPAFSWESPRENTQNSPFSSLAIAITIASTHFAYSRRDEQAELAWVASLNTAIVTHLSINPARRRVTSLMCPTSYDVTTIPKRHQYREHYNRTLDEWVLISTSETYERLWSNNNTDRVISISKSDRYKPT